MKKSLILLLILAIAVVTTYRILRKSATPPSETKEGPLRVDRNSSAFTRSFSDLMNEYFILKDALVEWDTVKVNRATINIQKQAEHLPMTQLKADSVVILTAGNLVSSVSSEAAGIRKETSILEKRKALNALTDQLYSLIRTVRYDGAPIYHVRCPMALGDSVEGYWLSSTNKIINPYLGKKHPSYKDKMLGCGEVVDSLDFSK
jgi:hypothetical protein